MPVMRVMACVVTGRCRCLLPQLGLPERTWFSTSSLALTTLTMTASLFLIESCTRPLTRPTLAGLLESDWMMPAVARAQQRSSRTSRGRR